MYKAEDITLYGTSNRSESYGLMIFGSLVFFLFSPSLILFTSTVIRELLLALGLLVLIYCYFSLSRSRQYSVRFGFIALFLSATYLAILSLSNGHTGFDYRYFYLLTKAVVFFLAAYELSQARFSFALIPLFFYILCVILGLITLFMSIGETGRLNLASDHFHAVGLGINYSTVTVLFLLISMRVRKSLAMLAISIAFLSFSISIYTASRGPILALVFSVLFAFWLNKSYRHFFPILITLVSFLFLIELTSIGEQLSFVYERFSGSNSNASLDNYSSGRATIYREYINTLFANSKSMLLGVQFYDVNNYPHNLFLEIALRFGFLNLFLCSFVSLFVMLKIWSRKTELISSDFGQMILVLLVYSLILSMFNSSIEQNFILFFCAGALVGFFDSAPNKLPQ